MLFFSENGFPMREFQRPLKNRLLSACPTDMQRDEADEDVDAPLATAVRLDGILR